LAFLGYDPSVERSRLEALISLRWFGTYNGVRVDNWIIRAGWRIVNIQIQNKRRTQCWKFFEAVEGMRSLRKEGRVGRGLRIGFGKYQYLKMAKEEAEIEKRNTQKDKQASW
jgi:hypothetical protein